ncbi:MULTISPECIES: biotin--[acetyl-CoA-carboxylase] ligase [unclassified Oceanispirochaeta]|uniref:biotin--[acetyl-CoA-carboxylase] ligase n=1 Tax=unclassified Oceanispirochaeta TaxID=2635722 RepID=UPI000E0935AD|nr:MULTISPECIES: biotin--[acetyl-CoA-carboxylase] ligase [unclassified Oceanispirochaeta]MBF9015610.1 biotin--[acetyl-CoA-carboxylase] ligase [Oceanispirochaeta sp. M2]NPD73384.1 biotin--[acetyl-CoA-carboxylase] ligase [Oceanispirochaeta sp. M1]RDG30859.1 biotin--[acetyl-CoA-carboxylase] ligase [Oceanispirochaeta sp. M1]
MNITDLNNPFGEAVYYKEETESTMIDAASLKNTKHGSIVITDFQSLGRGRGSERSWDSTKGKNLLFTVILTPEKISHPLLRIPLICGLALCEYLRETHNLDAVLKWPNDVLVDEKKIAGILCEYRGGHFLLGMGINCEQKEFAAEISGKTTSLSLQGVSSCSPPEILEGFLMVLKKRLENSEWKEDALSLLYKKDEEVSVCEGPPENETITRLRIVDLSDDGFLIVRELPDGNLRQISAGEIRFTAFK